MKGENTYKIIKVYCYDHQTTFEALAKPQIICTIEEHSLSNGFPNSEFWEFCCDCETFFPSKSDVTGNVLRGCPNCDRPSVRRFICQNCSIAAFESDEPSRGKTYSLNSTKGIDPICAGCRVSTESTKIISHDCKATDVQFFTARETCPFCLKSTVKDEKRNPVAKALEVCPQCQSEVASGFAFCSKCKFRLRSEIDIEKLGTDLHKPQLLGSLCPNCSTSIPPDSEFCVECGQAVVKAIPPPPPPPPRRKKRIVDVGEHEASAIPDLTPAKPIITASKPSPVFKTLVGVGIGTAVLIVIAVAISSLSKEPGTSNTNASGNRSTSNSYNSYSSNGSASNSYSSNLPSSFNWNYQGTISGKTFSMTLVKDGSDLKGSASAGRNTDTLSGSIDSYGDFTLDGYENGDEYTGIYSGRISGGGKTISGKWTMTDGTRETPFSLTQK